MSLDGRARVEAHGGRARDQLVSRELGSRRGVRADEGVGHAQRRIAERPEAGRGVQQEAVATDEPARVHPHDRDRGHGHVEDAGGTLGQGVQAGTDRRVQQAVAIDGSQPTNVIRVLHARAPKWSAQ